MNLPSKSMKRPLGYMPLISALCLALTAAPGASATLLQSEVLATATPAPAVTPAETLIALATENNLVRTHLVELTETFGPRLTGSINLNLAGEWARDRFASYGLRASLDKWGEFPVGFERGVSTGRLVAPEERALTFVTMAWTPGTEGAARGPVKLEPVAVEGFLPEDYSGAWILRRGREDRPSASTRRELDELLDQAGILGELIDGGANPIVDGRYKISMESLPTLVSIKLMRSDFEDLSQKLADGATGLEAEFEIENHFVEGPIEQFNVIADLVGSEFPDEYVIVGGHLDSWDPAVGAQDNATGVATTLEAARLIAASGIQPKRTIRFMLWGGEEQGLLGSGAYARSNPEVCAKTSAVLVHDGGGNYLSGISGPPALVEDLRTVFAPLLELDPAMPFKVTENRGLSPRGASDHSSFVAQGVPGFFWNQSGELDYNFVHHTLHDHVALVNDAYQAHSAIVVAVGAMGLANLDHMLDRTDLVRKSTFSNRRTMGVYLEENLISGVIEGSQAEKLGLLENDLVVAIEGVAVGSREEIVTELHKGDPKKSVTVLRGEERIEVVFEWQTSSRRRDR